MSRSTFRSMWASRSSAWRASTASRAWRAARSGRDEAAGATAGAGAMASMPSANRSALTRTTRARAWARRMAREVGRGSMAGVLQPAWGPAFSWFPVRLRGASRRVERGAHFLHVMARPFLGQGLGGHERARLHAVDVDDAVQVIDLVLQDAGVPAAGPDRPRRARLVEALDPHGVRTGDHGDEAGEAQAALEVADRGVVLGHQHRVDDDVERHRLALAGAALLAGQVVVGRRHVLDDGQAKVEADLGGRQADPGRAAHRLLHGRDQLLHPG